MADFLTLIHAKYFVFVFSFQSINVILMIRHAEEGAAIHFVLTYSKIGVKFGQVENRLLFDELGSCG